MTAAGILSDLRIVEASAFVAAPLGGMTLAQMGAEVIRIDDIRGAPDIARWPVTADGTSLFWAGLNKGKRSVALDLRSDAGREIATALATAPGPGAGLLLTNLPPRGWLDGDALRAIRPDLIQLVVQGDRHGGSAVDYTINPRTGLPFLTGTGAAPVNHVLPAWDLVTGQMAALGLLAAERHRTRTGRGQQVTLALEDVALAVMGHLGFIAQAEAGGEREAAGNDLYGAFGRDFATSDGGRIMVVGLTGRQWSALLAATGLADDMAALSDRLDLDLTQEGNRYRARDAIADLIAPWFAMHTTDAAAAALERARAAYGRYRTVAEMVADDPACSLANPLFAMVDQPGIGPSLAPGLPLRFGGSGDLPPAPAPRPGADTAAVLADVLGMSDAAYGALAARGIVPRDG
ncbi:mesaconyl-CoA isomerase [Sphingomonas sp. Leaf412]|uniref:CoA transferase n=1 Tax=Sphingomonas sp. Leaf412 TaxID=1736370 RepID=UPI0006F5A322|nr:CoA transferase [Sphingomonas sp. Leaf412]KQT35205.1 mesaconyl-CoA isomerase [Sphingomonas sp. Leaf412]